MQRHVGHAGVSGEAFKKRGPRAPVVCFISRLIGQECQRNFQHSFDSILFLSIWQVSRQKWTKRVVSWEFPVL